MVARTPAQHCMEEGWGGGGGGGLGQGKASFSPSEVGKTINKTNSPLFDSHFLVFLCYLDVDA